MTQDLIDAEKIIRERLNYFLLGNQGAVEFCITTLKLAHFWDDVRDEGNLPQERISDAILKMTWEIPMNPFYRAFQDQLIPLMVNTLLCWQDANVLDHGSEHDMHISYGLRSAGIQVLAFCVFLIGGMEWYKKVGPDIRRLLVEDLHGFVEEMKSELPE